MHNYVREKNILFLYFNEYMHGLKRFIESSVGLAISEINNYYVYNFARFSSSL